MVELFTVELFSGARCGITAAARRCCLDRRGWSGPGSTCHQVGSSPRRRTLLELSHDAKVQTPWEDLRFPWESAHLLCRTTAPMTNHQSLSASPGLTHRPRPHRIERQD